MRRYEYKIVKLKTGGWMRSTWASADAVIETLNREGRSGWHLVVTPQPHPVPWRGLLLEREIE